MARAQSGPVGDREGERDLVVFDTVIQPLSFVGELLDVSELLLIFLFVALAELLDDLEANLLDVIVLIVETGNHVREETTFVITLIGQSHQQVTNSLVEAFANNSGPVTDKHRKVVDLGRWIVKLLDWHDVRVSEANHVLQDFN